MEKSSSVVVLMGPPCSGKGTCGRSLTKLYGHIIKHVSVGEVLRNMGSTDAALRESINAGRLCSPNVVNAIVSNEVANNICLLLDGYPRDLEQAQFLSTLAIGKIYVCCFDIEKSLLLHRMLERVICADCGAIYSLHSDMPKNGQCVCGSTNLIGRNDDSEEVFNIRWKEYETKKRILIDYFERFGYYLHYIDASLSKLDVIGSLNKVVSSIINIGE